MVSTEKCSGREARAASQGYRKREQSRRGGFEDGGFGISIGLGGSAPALLPLHTLPFARGEEGLYYLWHRGLQTVGGEESIAAGLHLSRPSFEKDRCIGLTWKKGFRAAVQSLPGDPRDPTFTRMDLPDFAFLATRALYRRLNLITDKA